MLGTPFQAIVSFPSQEGDWEQDQLHILQTITYLTGTDTKSGTQISFSFSEIQGIWLESSCWHPLVLTLMTAFWVWDGSPCLVPWVLIKCSLVPHSPPLYSFCCLQYRKCQVWILSGLLRTLRIASDISYYMMDKNWMFGVTHKLIPRPDYKRMMVLEWDKVMSVCYLIDIPFHGDHIVDPLSRWDQWYRGTDELLPESDSSQTYPSPTHSARECACPNLSVQSCTVRRRTKIQVITVFFSSCTQI